ncbi:MAG: phosphoenolpyruvate carboxykinase (GTP) [Candidatus Omnitrophica bacterium]|nr:phosphoenolpyruvate carboxykinase (GTP) [Candidatus Omnitrophota bacterium]
MEEKYLGILKKKCGQENLQKLIAIDNPEVIKFVGEFAEYCNPDSVFVRTDSPKDMEYIRKKTIELKEEMPLSLEGHTVHFDGFYDQGRDKGGTKFFMVKGVEFGSHIHAIDRESGHKDVNELLKNIMYGKEMFVLFLSLGPVNSDFSVYAVQITDSAYVAHSEDILYRPGYEALKKSRPDMGFFKFVHSAGELDENNASKNVDKRRVYINIAENIVYSMNTQYAGNTVGLKKLALRLAINKADKEGWLAEHMFIMGVSGPGKRRTYFAGAFPSACGKTSTCMVKGETIVGDDISYLRKRHGKIFAANVERGIFGIIKDVNVDDDPLIWDVLNKAGEAIVSNILIKDGDAYWQGDGRQVPDEGINFCGKWTKGKTDEQGNLIPHAHTNARYTIRMKDLKNCDSNLESGKGVQIKGIIYGGRDSHSWPPVFQSFDWEHGVITIASSLESETTAATLGKEGVRKFNLMANLDFLSVPVGKYINNQLNFVKDLDNIPVIFGVNYFIRGENGDYLTGMHDKRVWLKWMELRIHNDIKAIKTPIGFIPYYEDLQKLFNQVLDKEYKKNNYELQFGLRVNSNLEKIERIFEIYHANVIDVPERLFEILGAQRKCLEEAQKKSGDYIKPEQFL